MGLCDRVPKDLGTKDVVLLLSDVVLLVLLVSVLYINMWLRSTSQSQPADSDWSYTEMLG